MDHNRTRQHRRGICSCQRLSALNADLTRNRRLRRLLRATPDLIAAINLPELVSKAKNRHTRVEDIQIRRSE